MKKLIITSLLLSLSFLGYSQFQLNNCQNHYRTNVLSTSYVINSNQYNSYQNTVRFDKKIYLNSAIGVSDYQNINYFDAPVYNYPTTPQTINVNIKSKSEYFLLDLNN